MGYGMQFPANQVGGWLKLWGVGGYGLLEVWVKRGSTVSTAESRSNQRKLKGRQPELRILQPVINIPTDGPRCDLVTVISTE
jgi:hypothetical protein